jgi:signal peptidase II
MLQHYLQIKEYLSTQKRRLTRILLILSITVGMDQFTKYLVISYINPFDYIEILPFVHLVLVTNKGVAFGMLKNVSSGFFIWVSIIAILLVIFLLIRDKENYVSLSLILGGAAGNLIDRIRYGKVIDFIDLSLGTHHWPAFNVADSALTAGILLILFNSAVELFKKKEHAPHTL